MIVFVILALACLVFGLAIDYGYTAHDRICAGLQLLPTWPDLSRAGCLYVPADFLERDGRTMSREQRSRCDAAITLWRSRSRPILLLGARTKGARRGQDEAAAEFLLARGVLPEYIYTREKLGLAHVHAEDTFAEAALLVKVLRLTGFTNPVIVTNRLQAVQIAIILQHAGFQPAISRSELCRAWSYQVCRWLLIACTAVDPCGRCFAPLRWARKNLWGSRV